MLPKSSATSGVYIILSGDKERKAGKTSVRRLGSNVSLVLTAALLASQSRVNIIVIILEIITVLVAAVALMLGSGDPKSGLPVVEGLILAREVMTLALTLTGGVAAALGEGAGALGQLGGDGRVLGDPVGQGVFAVLNDAMLCQYRLGYIRRKGLRTLCWPRIHHKLGESRQE